MKKVLLTGAGGFIGNRILNFLIKEGINVVAIYNSTLPEIDLDFSGDCNLVQHDLKQSISINDQFDAIIHAAALSQRNHKPMYDYVDNIIMTKNLIDFSSKNQIKKFIYLSSFSVYGEVDCQVVDETTKSINLCPYGVSKIFGEFMLKEKADTISGIALRLPGVVGKESTNPWICKVMSQALANQDIPIYNLDGLFNNIIHVDDLSLFVFYLLDIGFEGFEAVNLGCQYPMKISEVVKKLLSKVNSKSEIVDCGDDGKSFYISIDKAISLGFKPKTVDETLIKYAKEF